MVGFFTQLWRQLLTVIHCSWNWVILIWHQHCILFSGVYRNIMCCCTQVLQVVSQANLEVTRLEVSQLTLGRTTYHPRVGCSAWQKWSSLMEVLLSRGLHCLYLTRWWHSGKIKNWGSAVIDFKTSPVWLLCIESTVYVRQLHPDCPNGDVSCQLLWQHVSCMQEVLKC